MKVNKEVMRKIVATIKNNKKGRGNNMGRVKVAVNQGNRTSGVNVEDILNSTKVECYECMYDDKYYIKDTIKTAEGNYLCESCYEKEMYLGICTDCGRPFHIGYTGLGYEGNVDSLSLCSSCEGRNFKVCKGCGVESEYCLMSVDKTNEDCEIYQEGQALIEEAARERYEEREFLYNSDFSNEVEEQ